MISDMSFDDVLLFFHILAGAAWLGGGIYTVLLATRARQSGEQLKAIAQMEWVGPRLGGSVSVLLVGSGIWMVARSDAWGFGQAWIIIALVIFGVLLAVGVGFHGPQYKRIDAAVNEHGSDSVEAMKLASQSFRAAEIETVLLAVALLVMITKPGV